MSLLTEDVKKQLTTLFGKLENNVTIALFTDKASCDTCSDTESLLKEVSATSDKILFEGYDINEHKDLAKQYNVNLTPGFVLLDKDSKDNGIRFNGIPAGHEFSAFITSLMEVSGSGEEIPQVLKNRISEISKPVHIKVFVTLGCPHCSGAVVNAHRLALENPNITAEMIECGTFPDEANKYKVSGVPKIVINEEHELVGNQPLEYFLNTIEGI